MGEGDTLLNAVIGAAVTVVLSFTGVSPLLGGGVAGYLQRGTRGDGARVGALAGAIALVPFLFFVILGVGFFAMVPMMGGGGGMLGGPELLVVLLVGIPLGIIWNVGLGAAGGFIGVLVYEEVGGADVPG